MNARRWACAIVVLAFGVVPCIGQLTVVPQGKVMEAILRAKKERDARLRARDNHR